MMLTENRIWPCGHPHPGMSGRLAGTQPPPPGVCCQKDPAGNTVCSDGKIYPPGCPSCPAVNMPGVAEYRTEGSRLIPIPPAPNMCAGGRSVLGSVLTLAALAGVGTALYVLLRKK